MCHTSRVRVLGLTRDCRRKEKQKRENRGRRNHVHRILFYFTVLQRCSVHSLPPLSHTHSPSLSLSCSPSPPVDGVALSLSLSVWRSRGQDWRLVVSDCGERERLKRREESRAEERSILAVSLLDTSSIFQSEFFLNQLEPHTSHRTPITLPLPGGHMNSTEGLPPRTSTQGAM